jgi:hypothetical protein
MAYLNDKTQVRLQIFILPQKEEVRDKMWKLARIRKSLIFHKLSALQLLLMDKNAWAMWLKESKLHANKISAPLALRNFDMSNEEKWKRVAV